MVEQRRALIGWHLSASRTLKLLGLLGWFGFTTRLVLRSHGPAVAVAIPLIVLLLFGTLWLRGRQEVRGYVEAARSALNAPSFVVTTDGWAVDLAAESLGPLDSVGSHAAADETGVAAVFAIGGEIAVVWPESFRRAIPAVARLDWPSRVEVTTARIGVDWVRMQFSGGELAGRLFGGSTVGDVLRVFDVAHVDRPADAGDPGRAR
jgi:hypothetical protein